MKLLFAATLTVVILWLVFLLALLVVMPRGTDLRETRRLVPDAIRLLKALRGDATLPRSVRWWLRALLVYLAVPFDLIPDFIPVLGYADDVIVVALVLRRVVRAAGPDALDRHWRGTPDGLAAVKRLAGLRGS